MRSGFIYTEHGHASVKAVIEPEYQVSKLAKRELYSEKMRINCNYPYTINTTIIIIVIVMISRNGSSVSQTLVF